jgi:hypothetical protein
MILINDDGVMLTDEKGLDDVVASLFSATNGIMNELGCSDEDKFFLVSGLMFGGERVRKIEETPGLAEQVHDLLNEVWSAVEIVNGFVDTYPQRRRR